MESGNLFNIPLFVHKFSPALDQKLPNLKRTIADSSPILSVEKIFRDLLGFGLSDSVENDLIILAFEYHTNRSKNGTIFLTVPIIIAKLF